MSICQLKHHIITNTSLCQLSCPWQLIQQPIPMSAKLLVRQQTRRLMCQLTYSLPSAICSVSYKDIIMTITFNHHRPHLPIFFYKDFDYFKGNTRTSNASSSSSSPTQGSTTREETWRLCPQRKPCQIICTGTRRLHIDPTVLKCVGPDCKMVRNPRKYVSRYRTSSFRWLLLLRTRSKLYASVLHGQAGFESITRV